MIYTIIETHSHIFQARYPFLMHYNPDVEMISTISITLVIGVLGNSEHRMSFSCSYCIVAVQYPVYLVEEVRAHCHLVSALYNSRSMSSQSLTLTNQSLKIILLILMRWVYFLLRFFLVTVLNIMCCLHYSPTIHCLPQPGHCALMEMGIMHSYAPSSFERGHIAIAFSVHSSVRPSIRRSVCLSIILACSGHFSETIHSRLLKFYEYIVQAHVFYLAFDVATVSLTLVNLVRAISLEISIAGFSNIITKISKKGCCAWACLISNMAFDLGAGTLNL